MPQLKLTVNSINKHGHKKCSIDCYTSRRLRLRSFHCKSLCDGNIKYRFRHQWRSVHERRVHTSGSFGSSKIKPRRHWGDNWSGFLPRHPPLEYFEANKKCSPVVVRLPICWAPSGSLPPSVSRCFKGIIEQDYELACQAKSWCTSPS